MHMRRILLPGLVAAVSLTLSACGFSPMHARTSPVGGLSDIRVETGSERIDFLLQEALLDNMGARGADGPYVLRTETEMRSTGLGIGADAIVRRFALDLRVNYAVFRDGQTDPILQGSATGQASYDLPSSVYASYVAEREAAERAAEVAAERITVQIARAMHRAESQ